MTDSIAFHSATELAQLVRDKKVGCRELLDLYVARVEKYNPSLNAIIAERVTEARRLASEQDAELARGIRRGPLHGVPMTVKDSFDFPGLSTTWGVPEFRNNIPDRPADVVEKLVQAGANVFGKTNVPENLADWQTFNAIYGTTNNPWDLKRTPGGSSGGSAAALAAGLTALEIGSDIGGSIRNPAHYCGVYGHRPTHGIVPQDGHALPGTFAHLDLNTVGPLARSAFDLETALTIIAGPAAEDARGWRLNLPPAPPKQLSELRVGVLPRSPAADVDRSVTDKIDELASWLRRQGATVDERSPDIDHHVADEAYIMLLRAATSRGIPAGRRKALAADRDASHGRSDYFAWQARGSTMAHWEWLEWTNLRHSLKRHWNEFFQQYDILLCPIGATPAVLHNQQGFRWERMIDVNGAQQPSTTQMFWAGLTAMMNLPSTVAPIGRTSEGLPVGVQIVGPLYADLTCIKFAQVLEREYYGFVAPPLFSA
jgi:amidase